MQLGESKYSVESCSTMSLSINESLSAAQESYFEGEFRTAVDQLDLILANEQVTILQEQTLNSSR
jgi:hypothetical protein